VGESVNRILKINAIRGASLRITIPKSLWKVLDINDEYFAIGFYEVDGKILIEKMK
jgi:hypothetical protein